MKSILFLLTMFSVIAVAEIGVLIDSSTSTVPIAFTEGNTGSEAISCGRGGFSIKVDEDAYWGIGTSTTAPSTSINNAPIDAGDAYNGVLTGPLQTIYIRSGTGSALSSGKFYITCEQNR